MSQVAEDRPYPRTSFGDPRGLPRGSRRAPSDPTPTPAGDGLFLALAPMDGVTDWVHRELASELGGVSLCVSEFVRVTDRAPPERVFLRDCPELLRGGVTAHGVPVFVQLLGGDPRAMAEAARGAVRLGARGVDLNFGCPAKRVNHHDGGASILRCPPRLDVITRAVRDAVPAEIPVTAKIRLGWDESAAVETLARAAEAGGASWLTVHGRTKTQMYAPPVDYRAIARARAAVSIAVVANGDICCRESLRRGRQDSGASAFMIGRGALSDPDLFRRLRGEPDVPSPGEARCAQVLLRYVALMGEAGRSDEGRVRRVKQWLSLARVLKPQLSALFERLKAEPQLGPLVARLEAAAEQIVPEVRVSA